MPDHLGRTQAALKGQFGAILVGQSETGKRCHRPNGGRQIYEALKTQVEDGVSRPRDQLPSTRALAAAFGASRPRLLPPTRSFSRKASSRRGRARRHLSCFRTIREWTGKRETVSWVRFGYAALEAREIRHGVARLTSALRHGSTSASGPMPLQGSLSCEVD